MPLNTFANRTSSLPLSELDANFTFVSDSTNLSFLQSGTGAVSRTVQAKERDIKAAADYDTFANYAASALSGGFFTQNGAVIQRMTDRAMIGGAALNDCAFPNVAQDWLTVFQVAAGLSAGSIVSAQSAVLNSGATSETAGVGLVAGIQSQYFASAGTSAIGSSSYVVNNHATLATSAWAFYGEAHKTTAATGSVYGMEVDTRTLVASITPTPFQQGNVIGVQIASGCELASAGQFDASAAIQIADNPMQFKVGINFVATAIDGTDGVTGTGIAMALAKGHVIEWFNSSGADVGNITSACTDTTKRTNIQFNDSGLLIANAGLPHTYFFRAASAVNYFGFTSAATGDPLLISASGSDADVDIRFAPQGAGVMRFGTRTALGAETVTGYITIKDAGGTVRKLAVVS